MTHSKSMYRPIGVCCPVKRWRFVAQILNTQQAMIPAIKATRTQMLPDSKIGFARYRPFMLR
ncbi:Uncharacterised protein [Vibrio cholerae]|nr:Uncharacterised protein [Vibrio cholerae]